MNEPGSLELLKRVEHLLSTYTAVRGGCMGFCMGIVTGLVSAMAVVDVLQDGEIVEIEHRLSCWGNMISLRRS